MHGIFSVQAVRMDGQEGDRRNFPTFKRAVAHARKLGPNMLAKGYILEVWVIGPDGDDHPLMSELGTPRERLL